MELIVDANILFAAIIKDSTTTKLLFEEDLTLFAPDFLISEFSLHKKEILEKTHRSLQEFNQILAILEELIISIPKEDFEEFINEAEEFTPDKDDIPYFALALKLNVPIWSNDKKLKEQNKIKIYSTEEVLNLMKK